MSTNISCHKKELNDTWSIKSIDGSLRSYISPVYKTSENDVQ